MLSKFLAFLIACSLAWAQSNQASISGVVADEQGAVIPTAKITAVNTATQLRTETVTNGSGFYLYPIYLLAFIQSPSKIRGSAVRCATG